MITAKAGMATPWGKAQDVTIYADGIAFVSTAGHGGFKLDRKRNMEMPEALRLKGGWYEEDCAWARVIVGFPNIQLGGDPVNAARTVKQWAPDAWEALTGEKVGPEESHVRAQEAFERATADKFVVRSAFGDWKEGVPEGMVGVYARKGEESGCFLVPGEEYDKRGPFGFIVDPAKHVAIAKL